jgi:hypothetical protein
MRSLQDGEAFFGMVSTGFTRGYYHAAPPGQGACDPRRHKRDMGARQILERHGIEYDPRYVWG